MPVTIIIFRLDPSLVIMGRGPGFMAMEKHVTQEGLHMKVLCFFCVTFCTYSNKYDYQYVHLCSLIFLETRATSYSLNNPDHRVARFRILLTSLDMRLL